MRSVTEVMNGILARLYKPLDTTEAPSLTDCTLPATVRSTAGVQEQEQAYAEYRQTEMNFRRS